MLKRSDERRHPRLILNFNGKPWSFLSLYAMLAIDVIYVIEVVPL